MHLIWATFSISIIWALSERLSVTRRVQPHDISVQPISSLELDAPCSTLACDKDNPLDDTVWHTTKSEADTGPACCLHLHPVCVLHSYLMHFNPHPAAVEALSCPVVKPKHESGDAEDQKITNNTQIVRKDSYFTINKKSSYSDHAVFLQSCIPVEFSGLLV